MCLKRLRGAGAVLLAGAVLAGLVPAGSPPPTAVHVEAAVPAWSSAVTSPQTAGSTQPWSARVHGQGATKNLALRDAFRQAVEQRLGVLISGRTEVVDLAVVADRVVASSWGFVDGFDVLDHRVEDGVHRVTVDVRVSADSALNQRLAEALEGAQQDTRAEQALVRANLNDARVSINFAGVDDAAVAQLVQLVRSAGFSRVTVGGPGDIHVHGHLDSERSHFSHSWGFERDIVASSTCHLSVVDGLGDRAFSTARTGSAWSPNGREALQLAREQAVSQAGADLAAWLKDRARSPEQHLRVHVNLPPAQAQAWLEGVPGVLRVYVRGVEGAYTTLEADADCSAAELVTVLDGTGAGARIVRGEVLVAVPGGR